MKNFKKPTPYIVMLAFVVLLSLLCSVFCFQLLMIQGQSMAPTFHNAELCIINKMYRDYQVGDCVFFYCDGPELYLVKRIAALPGDTVQISGGTLLVNGSPAQAYPGCPAIEDAGLAAEEIIVPEGHYFVLGDNFSHSIDSRHAEVGFVSAESIKGKIIPVI